MRVARAATQGEDNTAGERLALEIFVVHACNRFEIGCPLTPLEDRENSNYIREAMCKLWILRRTEYMLTSSTQHAGGSEIGSD